MRKAKADLANAERTKKSDLAQCKLRYEHRIKAINDEIQSIQNQLSRYKRERDTYKHMLEGAQKTIADLKVVRQRRQSTTSTGKSDEAKNIISFKFVVLSIRTMKIIHVATNDNLFLTFYYVTWTGRREFINHECFRSRKTNKLHGG